MREYLLPPLSAEKPRAAVLFLHGVGADGRDLLSIGESWQPAFPDVQFVSVDAPEPFDMAPPGFGGHQWFSLKDFTIPAMTSGAAAATPTLHRYIDDLLQRLSLTADKLVLCGFSQGAMMALYAGTRYPGGLAGIISYAGVLLAPDSLPATLPPILLVHGDEDMVVPQTASDQAAALLKRRGDRVSYHSIRGLGHGIDGTAIAHGTAALEEFLKTA